MRLLFFLASLLIASCGAELQKDLFAAQDAMKVAKKAREAVEAKACMISLAYDGAIAAQV